MMAAATVCKHAQAEDMAASGPDMQVAEAGSIGGSIGKRDKTISGEEQPSATPDAKPGRSTQPGRQDALPSAIHLNEHWHGQNWTITLRHAGGSNYEGTWSHGYVTTFSITSFTGNSIRMERTDKPAFGACTGTYTGTRTGNRATGEAAVSNGVTGANSTWEASW
jgi:hypothetical protein